MNANPKRSPTLVSNPWPGRLTLQAWFAPIFQHREPGKMLDIVIPICTGLVLGSLLLVAISTRSQWAIVALLLLLSMAIAFLMGDLRRLLLIVVVVDIPLGLDIGLGNRLEHNGGPSGFMISLMTLAVVIAYARWIVKNPRAGRSSPWPHWDISLPVVLYMFAMLVSAVQAVEVWFSLTQLFLELQFLLLYFFVANQVTAWEDVRLIFTSVAVCLIVESLIILSQHVTGFTFAFMGIQIAGLGDNIARSAARLGGTLGHPNVAATFLMAALLLTLGGLFTRNRLVNRYAALVAILLGAVALVTTQSRAAWTIFAVLAPLLTLYALGRHLGKRAAWLLGLSALIIGVVFFDQIRGRLTMDDRGSAASRIAQSKLALNILNDHALTGVGLNNLWESMPAYLPPDMLGNENVVHDKYLTVWAETGLLGLISFLWIFTAAITRAIRTLRCTRDAYASIAIASLLAALLALALHMSVATFNERPRLELLWLMLAMIVAATNIANSTNAQKEPLLPQTDSPDPGRPR